MHLFARQLAYALCQLPQPYSGPESSRRGYQIHIMVPTPHDLAFGPEHHLNREHTHNMDYREITRLTFQLERYGRDRNARLEWVLVGATGECSL